MQLTAALSLLLLARFATPAIGQLCEEKEYRRPEPLSAATLRLPEFRDAVFLIDARFDHFRKQGTAYLIDVELGYALTAAHVVAYSDGETTRCGLPETVAEKVEAHGPQFGISRPELEVLACDRLEGVDLALLRFKDERAVASVERPLELEFTEPSLGPELLSIAWGKYRGQDDPTIRATRPDRYLSSGVLVSSEILSEADIGDSGAPLMDPSGSVVGTLSKRLGSGRQAKYVLLRNGRHLIEEASHKVMVNTIKGLLVTREVHALARGLEPHRRFKNVHLVQWSLDVEQFPKQYKDVRDLIRCPMVPAFRARDIDVYTEKIHP